MLSSNNNDEKIWRCSELSGRLSFVLDNHRLLSKSFTLRLDTYLAVYLDGGITKPNLYLSHRTLTRLSFFYTILALILLY